MAISFPNIDPVIFNLGPLQFKWYGVAYVVGILLGAYLIPKFAKKLKIKLSPDFMDSLVFTAVLGIVIGGRLGYVLFYGLHYFLNHPLEIFYIWAGGMSFHGGLLGLIVSMYYTCKKYNFSFWRLSDLVAVVSPIGIFFGRIANFINGELYGRPTDVSWAMVFPSGGDNPRHPSQLYEALGEGVFLFVIMLICFNVKNWNQKEGVLASIFLVFYGLVRFNLEFFREPDFDVGFVFHSLSMGQVLCFAMILAGWHLYLRRSRR